MMTVMQLKRLSTLIIWVWVIFTGDAADVLECMSTTAACEYLEQVTCSAIKLTFSEVAFIESDKSFRLLH